MTAFNDALKVNSKRDAPLNARAPGQPNDPLVSNLVTVQSLGSFAIAVPVLRTIWERAKALSDGGWTASFWTPLVICLLYALWQFAVSLPGLQLSWTKADWATSLTSLISAGVIGAANAAILAAAVIGLIETVS
jgi:hypothetical protein